MLSSFLLLPSSCHTVRELRDSNTNNETGLFKWTGKRTRSHTGEAVPAVLRPVMQSAVLLEFWGAHHLFLAALMQTLGKGSFVSKHLSFTNRESTVTSPMKAVKKMQSIK